MHDDQSEPEMPSKSQFKFPSSYNPHLPVQDAALNGWNYEAMRKLSGGEERTEFFKSPVITGFESVEVGPSGCKKNRAYAVGHAARSGLWVWTCMVHQRVVGYHVMPHSEGRRDCLFSLLRFKKEPPKAVWVDFACLCEESGLNWCPEYFKFVQWFHDIFHGWKHKCSERFTSSRLFGMNYTNSSVMEQVNSFLQSLRGVLRSGTTKVIFDFV